MILAIILIFTIYIFIFALLKTLKITTPQCEKCKISVLISAKNEENNINNLLKSLIKQDYPVDKFEVIIIDDNSNDKTFSMLKQQINEFSNFRVIKAENKIYDGKRGALQIGIENSKFENIVITDADCQPNPGFLISYSNQFLTNKKFIFGVAPYFQNDSLINKIACFDNFWVHLLTFSFANIGLPYSAAARSLGFTKETFNSIGGYSNTTDTLSGDDDLLLREIVKTNQNVGLIIDENAIVYSKAKDNFADLIRQKSRHTSTSNYYSNKTKFLLGLWHLINFIMLFLIILSIFNFSFIYLFIIKLTSDVLLVKLFMKTFKYKFSIFEILYLQIFYEFLLIVYFINGVFSKPKW